MRQDISDTDMVCTSLTQVYQFILLFHVCNVMLPFIHPPPINSSISFVKPGTDEHFFFDKFYLFDFVLISGNHSIPYSPASFLQKRGVDEIGKNIAPMKRLGY